VLRFADTFSIKLYTCVNICAMSNDDETEQRPEDDDYDLLTFGEAGARLTEEIRRQERYVAELLSAGADADALALTRATSRLEALNAAQIRNRKPSIAQLKASGFFSPP
jgi:hypothetical protein